MLGKKVGLTSRAVQQQLGVSQPDFGILLDDMEFLDGDEVPAQRLAQPKIEAEVAFVVGRDLAGAAPSWGEFLAALAYALPALEIVDSAIADWKITLVDTVADNASSGLYVLGHQPVAIGQLAGAELGMQMSVNGAGGLGGQRRRLPGPPAARGLLAGAHDGRTRPAAARGRSDPVRRAGADGAGGRR